MAVTIKVPQKLLQQIQRPEFKAHLYKTCTKNSEITSQPRVEQVYRSVEPFAIWILSKLHRETTTFIHSNHLHLLMQGKYRPLFDTFIEFDLMEVEKSSRIDHPQHVRKELGLDDIDDYRQEQKVVREMLDNMTTSDYLDYLFDHSVQTETYKPNKKGGKGRTKAYRLTFKANYLKRTSEKIDYILTDEQESRIQKAFEVNEYCSLILDKLRTSVEKVECIATDDDIEDYISDKVENSDGDEMSYASQKKLMQKIIKGERKTWQKGDYNERVMNTLLFASSEFRSKFYRTDTDEKMVGSDISSAVPFFLIDKFMNENPQFNDVDNYFKYVNLHDRISQGAFYYDIASNLDTVKKLIKKPMLKVFNRRRNYQLDKKKEKWAYQIEKYLMKTYPEFFQFICDLNTEKALKIHYGHAIGSKLAYVRKKDKHGGWIINDHGNYVTIYKPNRAMSLIYAEWETNYILECVERIHKQLGVIAMYTTYDAIYVGESHQPQVQKIMEQVAEEKFTKPLTIKRES